MQQLQGSTCHGLKSVSCEETKSTSFGVKNQGNFRESPNRDKKPASVTFTPSFEDFPEAQQAQQSLPATEATPKTKLMYASASHSSTTAKSTTPATNTDKQNAQPTKPVHQQKATSTSAVRDTPANSKPSTLKVPTTIQEDTETTETYTQLLEMLFAQIEQLKPLLIARKETTRNIVSKILASIQELLGEIIAVM